MLGAPSDAADGRRRPRRADRSSPRTPRSRRSAGSLWSSGRWPTPTRPCARPIVRSVIIFVLGLALSILASVLLARRMVAPIRTLQEGAARIGAGDLGHRVEVQTGDELEALGNELNRTAGQLEESYANLEHKVEARTRELAEANTGLTETLEQQTATGEILRVISSSPTDVQPVFDTIAESAARLCEAEFCFVFRFDGELLHFVSQHGLTPEGIEAVRRAWPSAPNPGTAAGRAILNRDIAHIPDVAGGAWLRARRRRRRSPPSAAPWASRCCATASRSERSPSRAPGRAVPRSADRSAEDVRRPGGHRHRERPALHRGAGAEP